MESMKPKKLNLDWWSSATLAELKAVGFGTADVSMRTGALVPTRKHVARVATILGVPPLVVFDFVERFTRQRLAEERARLMARIECEAE